MRRLKKVNNDMQSFILHFKTIYYRVSLDKKNEYQKHPFRGVEKCVLRKPMPKCNFNKVATLMKYTSAWVFSCKFAAYFQNIFS